MMRNNNRPLQVLTHRTFTCNFVQVLFVTMPRRQTPTLPMHWTHALWELHSHIHHYDSAAPSMARIFAEAFTKPGYSMEDFLDHTYGTVRYRSFVLFLWELRVFQLIDTEMRGKIKKESALAMTLRKDPFPESDAVDTDAGVSGRDAVSERWVFA